MAKETFYFSHDYAARADDKIKSLIYSFGWAGYGIYWAIIEDLYLNANALQTHYDRIAFDLKTETETVKSIINDFGLFKIKGKIFYSESVKNRLQQREFKSANAKKSANYRWKKEDANALQTQSDRNAIKESKVKESKVNIKKEIDKEKINFKIPQIDEVKTYFLEKKSNEFEAKKFWNFYQSKNWMVGKNKMKHWQAAASGWISRNDPVEMVKTKIDKNETLNQNLAAAKENFLNKFKNEGNQVQPLEIGAAN